MLKISRNNPAIRRQFGHHLLVQPNVHTCGIISVARIAKFLGKLLARAKARVDVERFHQVNDRRPPLQFFLLRSDGLVENGSDIDGRLWR
jgi:hypothetical protein